MTPHDPAACPLCGAPAPVVVEHRAAAPVFQNVTFATAREARDCATGRLDFRGCTACGFVWNSAFDEALCVYDAQYNNDVLASAYYRAHLDAMADRVLAGLPGDGPARVVEIGSGQGDFLRRLGERGGARIAAATGFDPAFRNAADAPPLPANTAIHALYFSPDTKHLAAGGYDAVISRHTIEHVADPLLFVDVLAFAGRGGTSRAFVETPRVEWILENTAFYDFFFEHCSLFSEYALWLAMTKAGFRGTVVPVYGDQYQWFQTTEDAPAPDPAKPDFAALFADYRQRTRDMIRQWSEWITQRRGAGKVALWGAASKGVTFAQMMDAAGTPVDVAIDMNAKKQGRHLPITGLRVTAPQALPDLGIASIIVTNPNYETEIRRMCDDLGWSGTITCL
ncbi:class I SAM-dependent methyltransferase [Novispirillum sp. DQ9]|uniref:class I SAM-dependent methyltransferase n=1 Tax=Novispirillum sp. DQ9 TaxID=3398612 RepID=UPI003C7B3F74